MEYMLQDKERFKNYLKKEGLSFSKTREEVFNIVTSFAASFSVEDVTEIIKRRSLTISRATTYRTIQILKEANFVQVANIKDRLTWYVCLGNVKKESQFFCMHCKKIVNLESCV